MYNAIIHKKISLLGYVIDDIRELERSMQTVTEPSLLIEYREEMISLIEELNSTSQRCIELLEVYIEECKELNSPVLLDYYRVLKELKKARL